MFKWIFLLLLLVPYLSYAGGPWLLPKKSGFFQLQSTLPLGSYNRLFLEHDKSLSLNRNALDFNFQAYLEYGISNKINLITVIPYKYIATGNAQHQLTNSILLPKGKLSGLSNYKLAFKFRISDKKIKAAISIQTSFNTAKKDLEKGLITGYQTNSLGLYTHIGKSFSNGKLYSFIESGINFASNNFSTFYEIHYELGYKLKPSFWSVITFDIRESLRDGTYKNENLRQTGFYTNNQEYMAYGVKGSYELKNKVGFTMATFGALSGNYVAYLGTVSLGIYKKW